jgi:uncharacterized SAM-binding protein YcdF (DUF218 family)
VTGLEESIVDRVARPFRSAKGAARTTNTPGNRFAPRSVLREFLSRRWSRWVLSALLVALLPILALQISRQQILAGLGKSLVVSDPLEHADLIYVLAGDFWGSRVLLGANLGSMGWAPRVILTGGRYQGRCACDLSVDFAVQHGYPRNLFLPLPMEAQSTVDEALAMRPIFHRLGAKRIILVTSNFHSRRALQVFRLFLPEYDFRMEGSAEDFFDPHTWCKTPQGRHLLFSEYQKMVGTFLVRFHLATADWLRRGRQ